MVEGANGRPAAAGGAGAPYVVIDEQGFEVGVVMGYREYVDLLCFLDDRLGRDGLPGYWRRALGTYLGDEADGANGPEASA